MSKVPTGWSFTEADFEAMSMPMDSAREQIQRRVFELLAMGQPVTLTAFGKNICTMYPGGKTEYHDDRGWR